MKKLSVWLIVIGLILMAVPLAGRAWLHYEQQCLLSQYEAGPGSDQNAASPSIMDEDFLDEVDALTDSAIVSGSAADEPGDGSQRARDRSENVLGVIRIPSIDSDLVLLEGSSSKELRYGAGHVTGTAMPGETGNCAVAGHRNYTFGTYFSRLDEVKPGDKIQIEYGGQTYVYTAEESFTVLPTDTWVLNPPEEKEKQVTLITCAPKGSNTHRLIVRGRLEEESITEE